MRDTLDEQIEAYEALLPTIKERYGPVWALVANRQLVETFQAFPDAARYAREHFGKQPVLIRHTSGRNVETAPFIHVHTEV